jgi:hypothetical protein
MNEKEFHDALEFPQKNGELFWQKLLQSQNCKNEEELLRKGTILADNPYFFNAIKNAADETERAKYESVKNTQEKIAEILLQELDKKEPKEKRATKAEELLPKLKEELSAAEINAQKSLAELEKFEKAIQVQIIDCDVVAGEYLHTLENIQQGINTVGDKSKSEITVEERALWEGQLELFVQSSNAEFENIKKLRWEHQKFREFKEFFDLTEKHKFAATEVEKAISEIGKVQRKIEMLMDSIEGIATKYSTAKRNLSNGIYGNAVYLLPKERFDKIILQTMDKVKLKGGDSHES